MDNIIPRESKKANKTLAITNSSNDNCNKPIDVDANDISTASKSLLTGPATSATTVHDPPPPISASNPNPPNSSCTYFSASTFKFVVNIVCPISTFLHTLSSQSTQCSTYFSASTFIINIVCPISIFLCTLSSKSQSTQCSSCTYFSATFVVNVVCPISTFLHILSSKFVSGTTSDGHPRFHMSRSKSTHHKSIVSIFLSRDYITYHCIQEKY